MRYASRRLLVFASIGFVANVAVAWTSVLVVDPISGVAEQLQTGARTPGPVWVVRRWSAPTALPLRPIPLGCLVNTVIMAVALYAPFLPFDVRRWRRWRQQKCLNCGYPMGASSTCTECGEPVAVRTVA